MPTHIMLTNNLPTPLHMMQWMYIHTYSYSKGEGLVQLRMDDVISLFVDDVMMLAYIKCMGTDHNLVHKNSKG